MIIHPLFARPGWEAAAPEMRCGSCGAEPEKHESGSLQRLAAEMSVRASGCCTEHWHRTHCCFSLLRVSTTRICFTAALPWGFCSLGHSRLSQNSSQNCHNIFPNFFFSLLCENQQKWDISRMIFFFLILFLGTFSLLEASFFTGQKELL